MARQSKNAHGGVPGEMLRRRMREANHGQYMAAQARLAELRQEAQGLIAPILRRLLVTYSEQLTQVTLEREAQLEVYWPAPS